MVFSEVLKSAIWTYHREGYDVGKIVAKLVERQANGEFREESFMARGIKKFLVSHQQKDNMLDLMRASGIGQLRTVCTDETVATIRVFTCSQEDEPQTHLLQR